MDPADHLGHSMNSAHRVLLLAYYAPPSTGIAVERTVGFQEHLPSFGWEAVVVTPRSPHFHQAEREGEEDPGAVVRTGSIELSRMFRTLGRRMHRPLEPGREETRETGKHLSTPELNHGSSLMPLHLSPVGSSIRRLIREFVYVPDAQIGWVPFAVRAGARVLERDREGDWVVYSSSVPYSAHLATARLASRFRLPWVAEFRDPWSAQDESQLPRSSFRRKLDRRLERWILRTSSTFSYPGHERLLLPYAELMQSA